MKLRTKLEVNEVEELIHPDSKILSVGSCFADNIGVRLMNAKFDISVNPFGIIFNPFSILNSLMNSMHSKIWDGPALERDGFYYDYNFHSDISAKTKEKLHDLIHGKQNEVKIKLLEGNVLQITFGTAWVYQLLKTNEIVVNCHKIPQNKFKKTLLNLGIIKTMYSTFFDDLFQKNPGIKVILSVSPVRHTKDGLVENNISKSILTLLCDHLQLSYKNVHYFPAYELVIDDLRDYRFYNKDMVHPSEQAIDYVYEAYQKSYCSDKTIEVLSLSQKIQKAEMHRFMNASQDEKAKHVESIKRMRFDLEKLK